MRLFPTLALLGVLAAAGAGVGCDDDDRSTTVEQRRDSTTTSEPEMEVVGD